MKTLHLFALALLTLALASCSAEAPADTGKFVQATYTSALSEEQSPTDTVESFGQLDTIYLSMEIKGRPKAGNATAKFYYRDEMIAETTVDVATVNKDVVFSIGQNTFIGFNLKPNSALPVGGGYRTELSFDGKDLGEFPFKIAPPKDAIPSALTSVTLAKGVHDSSLPVDETRAFAPEEKVVLVGMGNLGLATAIEANWFVSGKLDAAGTKSFTMEENKEKVPFYFSFLPEGGWPVGDHEVSLTMDGQEVAREKFSVK